jgi:hypothetical protein
MTRLLFFAEDGPRSGFPKQNLRVLLVCQNVEILSLFDTVDAVSVVGMCPLVSTVARVTLFHLFVCHE